MKPKKMMFYGVNIDTVTGGYTGEACERISVRLDDTYYLFVEDPSDGYRSYCDMSTRLTPPNDEAFSLEHTSIPVYVLDLVDSGYFTGMEMYRDEECTQLVFRCGTDSTDDYYPMCVMEYNIEVINEIYAEAILLHQCNEAE